MTARRPPLSSNELSGQARDQAEDSITLGSNEHEVNLPLSSNELNGGKVSSFEHPLIARDHAAPGGFRGSAGAVINGVLRRAEAEGIDLEFKSDENFLRFYASELRAGRFRELQPPIRGKLRKLGFVSYSPVRGFTFTLRAMLILKEVEQF